MIDSITMIELSVLDEKSLVKFGVQPGGYARLEAMHEELYALKKAHKAERSAHYKALQRIEILIEDLDGALRMTRARLGI
jgi:hypothetical protein